MKNCSLHTAETSSYC